MSEDDITDWWLQTRIDMYHSSHFQRIFMINHISGSLSMLGSIYIIQRILRDANSRKKICNQVMIWVSTMDILTSFFGSVLGQWIAPKGLAYGAVGTIATCTAGGSIYGFGYQSSKCMSASLAICYLLMVRYRWSEDRLRKIRPLLIWLPLILSIPLSVLMLVWDVVNFDPVGCTPLATYPAGCNNNNIQCIRGEKYVSLMKNNEFLMKTRLNYVIVFFHSLISFVIIVVSMVLLCYTVYQQEKANDRYRFDGSVKRSNTKEVGLQGFFYILAFLAVEIPMFARIGLHARGVAFEDYPTMSFVVAALIPLQGLLNAVVFLRPDIVQYLRDCSKSRRFGFFCRLIGCNRRPAMPGADGYCNASHPFDLDTLEKKKETQASTKNIENTDQTVKSSVNSSVKNSNDSMRVSASRESVRNLSSMGLDQSESHHLEDIEGV